MSTSVLLSFRIARRRLIAWTLILAGLASPLCADPLSSAETQKIEALIVKVSELKDARFVRNGWSYSAETAATFLRRKWQANESGVKTARDFVDKVASFSGTSGKPYLIRFDDGRETPSREFLLAALRALESSPPRSQGGQGRKGG